MIKFRLSCSILITIISIFGISAQNNISHFPKWEKGYFDIHHIETGGGNSTFMIFPDGTTMLIDAGSLNFNAFNKRHYPLKTSHLFPSDSLQSGGWIFNYIKQVFPEGFQPVIDYALITHFHSDHYGDITQDTDLSQNRLYKLSGITEIGNLIHIDKLIDRNYPSYNYPVDLRNFKPVDSTFINYLKFIDDKKINCGLVVEALKVGSSNQIYLKHFSKDYPDFKVRNIKSGGTIWTGKGEGVYQYIPDSASKYYGKTLTENQLSIALKFTYGHFDYYTGGDLTGLKSDDIPSWFDVETPVAKVVGPVEVATLDHHGNRDACNSYWIKTLQPKVFIEQSWCSDHPGQEVFFRLISKNKDKVIPDIFATYIHKETKVTYGASFVKAYKSMEGHVVIRVMPGGNEFYVFVLNCNSKNLVVKNIFGPYKCK